MAVGYVEQAYAMSHFNPDVAMETFVPYSNTKCSLMIQSALGMRATHDVVTYNLPAERWEGMSVNTKVFSSDRWPELERA